MYNKLKTEIDVARKNQDTKTLLFYSTFLGDIQKASKAPNNKSTLLLEARSLPLAIDELVVIIGQQWKKTMEANLLLAVEKNLPQLKEQMHTELELIEKFLPKMLSEDELKVIIKDFIDQIHADGLNLGVVMKYLKSNYNGRYDSQKAVEIVKRELS